MDKTKVVIFRKGGIVSHEEKWTRGFFVKATSTLSDKALKALRSLFAIMKDKEIPLDCMLGLFDSFVGSILSYGCEKWGFSRADNIE